MVVASRETVLMRVSRRVLEADGIVGIELRSLDVSDLMPWPPGAHIELLLEPGLSRQYSLCGDPLDRHAYHIAVLREPQSRGGSELVHLKLQVGAEIEVRGPRNNFELDSERDDYLFIAGGIGITPIKAMVESLSAEGRPWRLHYGGRTTSSMAFVDQLRALPHGAVTLTPEDERGRLDVDAILASTGSEAVVYCCGPEGLIEAVRESAARRGLDVHFERFGAVSDAAEAELRGGLERFVVELRRSGVEVEVGPEETILDAVRTVDTGVPSSCEDGYCGTCETTVLGGAPLHRDSVLTPAEQAAGESMMICVGRSCSERLVLDI